MTDPGCVQIKEWTVSFYQNDTRKWKYGVLTVTPEYFEFVENESDGHHPYTKIINHCDVIGVKKSSTSLIFRAIVIIVNDKTKYWISSLPDQRWMYNVLHYFQRQNLFSCKKLKKTTLESVGSTEMGRKLLSSVIDSENTLNNAVNVLHEQGTQIQSSMATMHDIHNDLDIADNILSGLESWLGRWQIPQRYKKESLEIIQAKDLPAELDYEILYTKFEMGTMNCQHLGILRVCTEGIIILTDKQRVVHNFKWNEISVVKVISLCEIMITRYMIGRPDLTYDLVCTNLLPVLRLLDRRLKTKMEYKIDIFKEERPRRTTKNVGGVGNTKDKLFSKMDEEESPTVDLDVPVANASNDSMTLSSQVQGQKQIVTDQEVEEISQTLSNIKSIALATGQELGVQNDNIDKLTSTVDRANQRIQEHEKRIKHLT